MKGIVNQEENEQLEDENMDPTRLPTGLPYTPQPAYPRVSHLESCHEPTIYCGQVELCHLEKQPVMSHGPCM